VQNRQIRSRHHKPRLNSPEGQLPRWDVKCAATTISQGLANWTPPCGCVERIAESGVLGDLKIAEVGFTRRGFVRPQHEHLAPMLGGVWAMLLAGFDMD
jgi:hypothetical protein